MQQLITIATGGALGALARYGMATAVYRMTSESFPWGTLVVNLSGSFVLGVLVELFEASVISPEMRSLLTIGFLGAYTTFSTYTLESVNLLRQGEIALAAWNIIASNVLGLFMIVLGSYASRIVLKTLV